MEKHRLKVRVTRPDRSKARLAFEIDGAANFSAHAQSPGFEGLGGQGNYFKVFIKDYEIWIETPAGTQRAEIGLTFAAGQGTVEFLEVPAIPKPPVEEATRVVSMVQEKIQEKTKSTTHLKKGPTTADDLPVFELDHSEPKSKFAAPELVEAPKAAPAPAPAPVEAAASRAVPAAKPASAAVTGAASEASAAAAAAAEPAGPHPLAQAVAKIRGNPRAELFFSWAIPLLSIALLAELCVRIVVIVNPLISSLPSAWGAVLGVAAALGVALCTWLAHGRAGFPGLSMVEVLRTLAVGSLLLPIWALSFAFPPIVGLLAALLVAGIWSFIFLARHGLGQVTQLSSLSLVLWAGLMGAGYWLRQTVPPAPAAIEVATAPAPADVARDPASAQPAIATGEVGFPVETTNAPASPELSAMMRKLKGVDAKSVDEIANAEFFAAVRRGDINAVKRLVRLGKVDPILAFDGASTALHLAAAGGQLEVVKYLLSRKIAIDARDAAGSTALTWAVFRGHREVAQWLLKKGADATIRNDAGDLAFDIASRQNDVVMLQVLREYGRSSEAKGARVPASRNRRR